MKPVQTGVYIRNANFALLRKRKRNCEFASLRFAEKRKAFASLSLRILKVQIRNKAKNFAEFSQ